MPKTAKSVVHGKPLVPPRIFIYIALLATLLGQPLLKPTSSQTNAISCPDLKVIFARGSGGERYNNNDFLTFKSAMESKLNTSSLSYEIEDLDYPAIGVGADNISVALGALISGGESYAFGESVKQGIANLVSQVNSSVCKNTKYVVAGYSQGAMVVSGALQKLNPSKLIYAATFGDPKIYLPEGFGMIPPACKGDNLSEYRVYVPDCRAYKGLLGAKEPYTTADYAGKVGVWCNKHDIFCSSHYSVSSHTSYDKDNLYEDASRFIFSKIAMEFGFSNEYTSPHDTAILIDSTGSMSSLIEEYKAEALRLAEKTLNAGGRVALYDYRDLNDPYQPTERCNFETCTYETFQAGLAEIVANNGGDADESLLSASLHVMQSLNWNFGSTKSLVILTDAGYHSPDHDGTTFFDVKTLSQQIDPVNFYIITTPGNIATYQPLAEATSGAVASTLDDLSILTDTIIARYDSLPRVEESLEDTGYDAPHLEINNISPLSDTEYKINITTDAEKAIVILNDTILGVTDFTEFTITNLNSNRENVLTLVPFSSDTRGEPVSVQLKNKDSVVPEILIPKTPNTGKN